MVRAVDLETTASEACTRGGAFALLLSLALASLIPIWSHRKEGIILGRYLSLRLNLVAALDALDEDPLWQEYKRIHETDVVPIEQLVSLRINSSTLEPMGDPTQAQPQLTKPSTPAPLPQPAKRGPPAPPAGLGFVVGFEEVRQAADYLTQLNDSDLLTRSRNASDLFNFSIYRWVLKRDNLIAQNLRNSAQRGVTLNGEPDPRSPANFAPATDKTALLRLTLGAVRELAKEELPPISNTVKLGPNDNEVDLTTSSLPRSLYGASLFGQVLLFFVIVYFGAFTRKAASAIHFPSQETMFGAFAAARSTLAVFFLALWTPLAVSLAILLVSYSATSIRGTLGLAVCSLLIGLAVASIEATLNSKSYFRTLLKGSGTAKFTR